MRILNRFPACTLAFASIPSRAAISVLLAGSLALAACSQTDAVGALRDAALDSPVAGDEGARIAFPDTGPDAVPIDTAACSLYPETVRQDDAGLSWWWWYFHWDDTGDVPGFCAEYGNDAKMVVEVVAPKNPAPSTALPACASDEIFQNGTRSCAVPDSYRFESSCTAGQLLFELPSKLAFTGYYHVESTRVPTEARHAILKSANCDRDLYVGQRSPSVAADGGTLDVTESEAGQGEAGQSCPSHGGIPVGGTCGAEVTRCPSAWTGNCSMDDALAATATPMIHACGGSCGLLSVGFSGGCATVVKGISDLFGPSGPGVGPGTAECIERYLMGHRFDCVPSDGWVGLYVDGCVLP